jgi:hypothetical protein
MAKAKTRRIRKSLKLLICIEMVNRETILWLKMPGSQCQEDGCLPVFWHTKGRAVGGFQRGDEVRPT